MNGCQTDPDFGDIFSVAGGSTGPYLAGMIKMGGVGTLAAWLVVVGSSAQAQQPGQTGLLIGTSSFVVARYATVSASSLYAGYSLGSFGVLLAAVHNPRSEYSEIIGGVVTRLAAGKQASHVAIAVADATDGRYLQTYLVPSLSLLGVTVSGTFEWYEPLGSGTRQLDVNPVSILAPVLRTVNMGLAYTLALAEGAESRHRVGPVLQLAIPRGTLYLEVLRNGGNSKAEVRIGSQAAF